MPYTSSVDGLRYTHCEGTNGQVSPLCDKPRGQVHRKHEVLCPDPSPQQEPVKQSLSPITIGENDWINRYMEVWMEQNFSRVADEYFRNREAEKVWFDRQLALERCWRKFSPEGTAGRAGDEFVLPDGFLGYSHGRYRRYFDIDRQQLVWVEVPV